jgi:hypothetical protein
MRLEAMYQVWPSDSFHRDPGNRPTLLLPLGDSTVLPMSAEADWFLCLSLSRGGQWHHVWASQLLCLRRVFCVARGRDWEGSGA